MANALIQAIEQMGREKGIDSETIIQALQDAMLTAARKHFKEPQELISRYNREAGRVEVFACMTVVGGEAATPTELSLEEACRIRSDAQAGDIIELPKDTSHLGRIAAAAAKQVIYQKMREAERDNIFEEYSGRIGEVVNGTVKRFERGRLIVDIGHAEAKIPKEEQIRTERYNQGDRVRGIIINVERRSRGPQVILSRSSPEFLVKLFEMEVPEIYDGTVRIVGAVREPGERAKIAVLSRERDVDPVGSCVGMKGSRVQAVIRELGGEKIDIVEYADEITTYAINALNPAKIDRVNIQSVDQRILEVVVSDKQQSLAIGKRGQNVRLAARLLGWKIDIKSESEKRKELEVEMARMAAGGKSIAEIPDLSDKIAEGLQGVGLKTVEELAMASPEQLLSVPGVGPKTAENIFNWVRTYLDRAAEETRSRQAQEAAAALAAEAPVEAKTAKIEKTAPPPEANDQDVVEADSPSETKDQDGAEADSSPETKDQDGAEAASSPETNDEDGTEASSPPETKDQDGAEASSSPETNDEDGTEAVPLPETNDENKADDKPAPIDGQEITNKAADEPAEKE